LGKLPTDTDTENINNTEAKNARTWGKWKGLVAYYLIVAEWQNRTLIPFI
jgi:hypothetical protein